MLEKGVLFLKKRIIWIIVILIIAVGGSVGAYIITEANKEPAIIEESEAKYKTTLKECPTDGSTPTDYSSMDNVAFALWKIENTNEFKTITTGTSDASVASIQIYNTRTVKDSKSIVSTVSSGMVSSGKQKYFLDNKVLLRDADKINGFDTTWKTNQPECLSNKGYISRYGWLPFSCTGYIICDETTLEASELIQNDDGTYSIKLSLNPEDDYAPFWYRREVLTNASSSIVPEFYSISIEYTMSKDWTILESRIQEEYKVKAMGIEAVSKTNCVETFTYYDVEFNKDELSFFEQYENLEPADGDDSVQVFEDDALTMITSSLQSSNGSDKYLNVSLKVADQTINGIVSINISDLENIKIKAKFDDLYIEYSDALYLSLGGLKVKGTIDDLSKLFSGLGINLSSGVELDASKIISDINSGTIVKSEDKSDITLSSTINLMGISIPLNFHFSYIDGVYSIIEAGTEIQIEGMSISASISETDSIIPQIDKSEYDELSNTAFIFEAIGEIITQKKANISAIVEYNDLSLMANGNLDFTSGLKLDINLTIQYQEIEETFNVKYLNDTVYIQYQNIALKLTVDDLFRMLEKYGNISLGQTDISLDLNSILGTILSIDYKELIQDLNISEDSLDISISLNQFIQNMSAIQIGIVKTEGLELNVILDNLKLSVDLAAGFDGEITVDDSIYSNLGYLDFIIDGILGIYNEKKINLEAVFSYNDLSIGISGRIDFISDIKLDLDIEINYQNIQEVLNVKYINNVVYLTYNENYLKISVDELMAIVSKYTNIDLGSSLPAFDVNTILTAILSIDFKELVKELKIDENSANVTIGISQFIAGMADLQIKIEKTEGLKLTAILSDLQISVNAIAGFDGDVLVEDSQYVSLSKFLEEIDYLISIIGKQSLNVILGADVYLDINGSKEKVSLEMNLDLILIENQYHVDGIIRVQFQNVSIETQIIYSRGYIYIDLFDQAIQIPVSAISSLVTELTSGADMGLSSINLDAILSIIKDVKITDENTIEINLQDVVAQLGVLTLYMALSDTGLDATIDSEMFNVEASILVIERNTIDLPAEESIIEFSEADILNMMDIILGLSESINNNSTFTVNLNASVYGVIIDGIATITKDLDAKISLSIYKDPINALKLDISYVNNILYMSMNGLNIYFSNNDFSTILATVMELVREYLPQDSGAVEDVLGPVLDSFFFEIVSKEVTAEHAAFSFGLDILQLKGAVFNVEIQKDSIIASANINSDIQVNELSLGFSNAAIAEPNKAEYLAVANIISLFQNLETGLESSGELGIEVMGYHILLPYEMKFKLDLIELLKGENVFKAIELELFITSEYYEPIQLTIINGFIYLNSMETKYKYEIPVYSISNVINPKSDIPQTTLATEINIADILDMVIGYANGIEFKTTASGLTIALSNSLMGQITTMISTLLNTDVKINDLRIEASNLTDTTADFDVSVGINIMGMDIAVALTTNTTTSDYVSSMTPEEMEEYVLTANFIEHPFASRVLDILKMVQGIAGLNYAGNGHGFDINLGLDIDSSLVTAINVNGNLGVFLDLQAILDGNDIWSAFKLDANVNIKATTFLFGAKVNINLKVFSVGDGFLYLIVDGDAIGISFSIAEQLIDLQGMASDITGTDAEGEDQPTVIYLNDLLNQIISGFTTKTVGNTTTLSLNPSAVRVIDGVWRGLVEMVDEQIASIGVSTVNSLIDSITNFDMDVTGFDIKYTSNSEGLFENLQIVISGYRHNTYTKTQLPITLTSTGELSSTYFDASTAITNEERFVKAKSEVAVGKEMIKNLGSFVYTEEFYTKAKEVQAYLDSMSDIAKTALSTTTVADMITYYEMLNSLEVKLRAILAAYHQGALNESFNADIIACYDAYDFFLEHAIFTPEELAIYSGLYDAVAQGELAGFADDVNNFTELTEFDFVASLDEILSYGKEVEALWSYYNGLSSSYQNAFKRFYPEGYEKLDRMVNAYTKAYSVYVNGLIYQYMDEVRQTIDLANAQAQYSVYQFELLKQYSLTGFENEIAWKTLENYIYATYVSELDKEIGKAIEVGYIPTHVVTIPKLNEKYLPYNEFKIYFKNDITTLNLEAARMAYKEAVEKILNENFAVKQQTVSYGIFQSSSYYDYKELIFDENNYAKGLELCELFTIIPQEQIKQILGDENTNKFRIIYYVYDFMIAVKDDSLDIEVLKSKYAYLEDVNVNSYVTKSTTVSWGIKKLVTTNNAYSTILQATTTGYAYEAYQAYLAKIAI